MLDKFLWGHSSGYCGISCLLYVILGARIVDCNGSASVCLLRIMINAEVSLCSAKQRYKLTKLFKIAYDMNQNHITVQTDSKSRN